MGGLGKNSFRGAGKDIFWNNTLLSYKDMEWLVVLKATHGHEIPISHHPSDRSSWNTLHGKTIHINYTVR